MKGTVISSSEMAEWGRYDARFFALLERHRPVVVELREKFSNLELIELARQLPYAGEADEAVWPAVEGSHHNFCRRLERYEKAEREGLAAVVADPYGFGTVPGSRLRGKYLAAYCAAAAENAIAEHKETILELRKKELESAKRLANLVKIAKDKGARNLQASLRGKA